MDSLLTFAKTQSSSDDNTALVVAAIIVAVLGIIAIWRVFEKAHQPGWAAIIPIYNTYILLKIVGRPGWWLLLYLIPFVNLIVHIFVSIGLAKAFGKSSAFGIFAIWFFSIIGYFILAFGGATYKGSPNKTA